MDACFGAKPVGRAAVTVLALLFAAGIVSPAAAFDGQAFSPAVDPQGYFSLHSSKTAPAKRVYVGLWYNYAKDALHIEPSRVEDLPGLLGPLLEPLTEQLAEPTDPLDPITQPILCALEPITDPLVDPAIPDPLVNCPDELPDEIVLIDQLHAANFVASYSLTDWAEIAIDVPVSYIQSDVPGVNEGVDIDDIKINGKFGLVDPGAGGLGFAVVPFVDIPVGDEEHLTSNSEFDWGVVGVGELVGSRMRSSLNLGYRVNDDPFDDEDQADEILLGLGLGYLLIGQQPILGVDESRLELIGEIFGSTAAPDDIFEDGFSTPVEFLVGGRYYWADRFLAGLGGGRRITDGINSPDFRVVATAGYTWQPRPAPPAPPAPPPPLAKVVVTDEQIITLEPIYFDFDKSTIKPESFPVLDQVAQVMRDKPDIGVRVEGHTDWKGTDQYNQALSERRCASVVKYLVEKTAIDPARLTAQGFGESRPVTTNETDEGRAQNRRTEFHISRPGG